MVDSWNRARCNRFYKIITSRNKRYNFNEKINEIFNKQKKKELI